jgi:hypothetical protein
VLAGGHELLGQQIAQPTGGLDRPRPLFEGRGPLEQLVELATTRPHLQLRKLCFVAVDHDRGMRPLVRVDADDDAHVILLIAFIETAVGTPDYGRVRSHLFRATPRRDPASQQLDRKPDGKPTAGT